MHTVPLKFDSKPKSKKIKINPVYLVAPFDERVEEHKGLVLQAGRGGPALPPAVRHLGRVAVPPAAVEPSTAFKPLFAS